MNNLKAIYERILEVLRKISKDKLLKHQRREPKMSDLELISLSLTAEYLDIDSENENDLFRKLPSSLKARATAHPIKVIVLHKDRDIMAISYTLFVQLMECLKVLILVLHRYTTFII